MICPHCGKAAIIPDVVKKNLECYGGPVLSVTRCCGKGVRVAIIYQYELTKDTSGATHDGWGRKLIQDSTTGASDGR